MNTCIIIAAFAGFFSMSLHGATIQISSQDAKSEFELRKLANNAFYSLARTYSRDKSPQKRQKILANMQGLLKENPHIYSTQKVSLNIVYKNATRTISSCCPLRFALEIAYDRYDEYSYEVQFFKFLAEHDKDKQRRIDVIRDCILKNSFLCVHMMLETGADVTHVPEIMKLLVGRCRLFTDSQQDLNILTEKADLEKALNSASNRFALSQISRLLLEHRVDLSGVAPLIDLMHFDTCTSCRFIRNAVRSQYGLSMQQPSAPSTSLYSLDKSDHKARKIFSGKSKTPFQVLNSAFKLAYDDEQLGVPVHSSSSSSSLSSSVDGDLT